jgi:hypothetical protein
MEKQKQESERKLTKLPAQQFVIPNSQEIDLSIKCNRQISTMPYAVKSFKFTTRNIDKFNLAGAVEQREGYREICRKYPKSEFLLHIQVKEGTQFTSSQMDFIENVQDIPETSFFCVYEKSFKQTAKDFEKQILKAKEKYSDKEIVPAVEVYTEFNDEKVAIMKKHGIKKCVIIYRNYQKHEFSWSELMWALDTANISRFVFGVTPRYRRKNKVTILLAPLRYGANYVAHGLPWSGGKGQVYVLGNNLTYNVTQNFTYPASRVQALNKVNTLTQQIQSLSIQQVETLLN